MNPEELSKLTYIKQCETYTNYLRGLNQEPKLDLNDSGEMTFHLKKTGSLPYAPRDFSSPFPNDAISRELSGQRIATEKIAFCQGDA